MSSMNRSNESTSDPQVEAWRAAISNIEKRVGPRPATTPFLTALTKYSQRRPQLPTCTQAKAPQQQKEPMANNPLDLDLSEVIVLLRDGHLSAETLTELAVERLSEVHQWTNAVEQLDVEGARTQARHADARRSSGTALCGPLCGIPMAHKSLVYRDGFASACGSRLGDLLQPQTHSTILGALDQAGSVGLGQLHMTELAFDPTGSNAWIGDCRNPWQPEHVPGGSSSGSAVAVATRCVFGSLGSDTAGSIRIPSALCGVTGLKQTYGQVSRHGTMALSGSHDHIGPLARTAEDCAHIFRAIAGPDPLDSSTAFAPGMPTEVPALSSLDGVRIGVPVRFFRDGLDAQIRQRLDESLKELEAHGAIVKEVADYPYEEINALSSMVIRVEAGAAHRRALASHPDRYSTELAGWLRQGHGVPAMLYETAHHLRGKLLAQYLETVMKDVHALHVPVIGIPTPTLAEAQQGGETADRIRIEMTRLTRPFSYFGLPALSLPCGFTKTPASPPMPTAFQLVGHPFDEATILGIGAFYQQVTNWHRYCPPLSSVTDDQTRSVPRGA